MDEYRRYTAMANNCISCQGSGYETKWDGGRIVSVSTTKPCLNCANVRAAAKRAPRDTPSPGD